MSSAGTFASGNDALSLDEALWLLSSFCSLNRKAFDATLFTQRYPPPVSGLALSQAGEELDLSLDHRRCSLPAVLAWRMPVALRLRHPSGKAGADARWALVLNADESRVVLLEREAKSPAITSTSELTKRFMGEALSLVPRAVPSTDPDNLESRSGRFGLRWFVPELLKHRRVWRDVLIASLVLQLLTRRN